MVMCTSMHLGLALCIGVHDGDTITAPCDGLSAAAVCRWPAVKTLLRRYGARASRTDVLFSSECFQMLELSAGLGQRSTPGTYRFHGKLPSEARRANAAAGDAGDAGTCISSVIAATAYMMLERYLEKKETTVAEVQAPQLSQPYLAGILN
ncbi:uncharacterized protein TrAtP1_012763 [Trichoderma atroviride]|uniref:uncharacterized protein n=1 Tax=Hypocrea atroviridis TaxID=63577 RepID=UPI003323F714|nr:hypothetical protein TrAtP1_012763 [Trichoderma atroviride]